MKNKRPTRDQQNELLNESRNELQKAVLLCHVLDKSAEQCRQTIEKARVVRGKSSPKTTAQISYAAPPASPRKT